MSSHRTGRLEARGPELPRFALPRRVEARHVRSPSRDMLGSRLGSRVALVLLLLLALWHTALSPRRYPPMPLGVRRLQLPAGLPPPPEAGVVEVVVSRYKDDLEWLPALAALLNASVTVYCKESPHPPPTVPCTARLPNAGNEGHSYLHHMTVRYDSLAPLTLFLPDTLWDDPTRSKPHFTYDVVTAVLRARGRLQFADMHLPDSAPRRAYSWLKEVWQGFKLPCESSNRGGAQCRWDGTSGGNGGAGGVLQPAEPVDFYDWMWEHTGTRPRQMWACGWGFRGVFAVGAESVHKHPPGFYAHLEAELGKHAFPVAGMYMERMWRRVFLCS